MIKLPNLFSKDLMASKYFWKDGQAVKMCMLTFIILDRLIFHFPVFSHLTRYLFHLIFFLSFCFILITFLLVISFFQTRELSLVCISMQIFCFIQAFSFSSPQSPCDGLHFSQLQFQNPERIQILHLFIWYLVRYIIHFHLCFDHFEIILQYFYH